MIYRIAENDLGIKTTVRQGSNQENQISNRLSIVQG